MKLEDAYIFSIPDNEEIVFRLPYAVDLKHQNFYNRNGELLGWVRGREVVIYPTYKWNGCSPRKWLIKNRLSFGTPNGFLYSHKVYNILGINRTIELPKTAMASLLHDFLCQFIPNGLTQRQIDKAFLYQLEMVEWKLAWLYYKAVRFYMLFVEKRG